MKYICCILIGYLIGAFNPSYLIAKIRGFDIRTKGSGNAGASNALILFGKAFGILCAVLDIAKAYFAIYLAQCLFPQVQYAFAISGVACIAGHIFPWYMGFKGGKGLACLGGMILYFDRTVFLIMLIGAVLIALITDYICVVPVVASISFPIVYCVMKNDIPGAGILTIVTAIILFKHLENFKRIRLGTEIHLSYLWKPEEEIDRMKDILDETDAEIETHFSCRKN